MFEKGTNEKETYDATSDDNSDATSDAVSETKFDFFKTFKKPKKGKEVLPMEVLSTEEQAQILRDRNIDVFTEKIGFTIVFGGIGRLRPNKLTRQKFKAVCDCELCAEGGIEIYFENLPNFDEILYIE